MGQNAKERLREFARSEWGDEWFLETVEFATGNEQYRVHHTEGLVTDGIVIRGIAELGDAGEITVTRQLINTTEYIATIED